MPTLKKYKRAKMFKCHHIRAKLSIVDETYNTTTYEINCWCGFKDSFTISKKHINRGG